MNHEEGGLLLSALVDNELSPQERARIEGHLQACMECRSELASLRRAKALLAAAPRRAMPSELVAAIEARVEGRATSWAWLRGFVSAPRLWAPAGALALAALLMTAWMSLLDRDPDQFVPLEPLLAAHARYTAESLVPEDNLVAASYSALSSTDASPDQDAD